MLTNSTFLTAIFGSDQPVWTTQFKHQSDPNWNGKLSFPDSVKSNNQANSYFSTASLIDDAQTRSKETFKALHCVVLDDVGESELPPSWKLETSPNNFQLGYILDEPITDRETARRLVKEIQDNALVKGNDKNGNNIVRYVRLPEGWNDKHGEPFEHVVREWSPERRYGLSKLRIGLGLIQPASTQRDAFEAFGESVDVPEMVRQITAAEHFFEPCLKLTASYAAKGVSAELITEVVQGLMLSVDPKPSDWASYYSKIPNMVAGAVAKYGRKKAAELEVNDLERLFPKVVINTDLPKANNWVIDNFLTDELFCIAGAAGTGKSSMLFQLAMAAAWICPVDYELKPTLRRKVVYLTEDSRQAEDIVFGLRKWGGVEITQQELDEWLTIIEVHRVDARVLASMIKWKTETDTVYQNGLEGRVVRIPPLIVFDTAAATFALESENDNAEVSSAISAIKYACSPTSTPLWIISHTAKIQRNEIKNLSARGAGAWTGDVNGTAYVFKDEREETNKRFCGLGKKRYVPLFEEISFDSSIHTVLVQHELGHWEDKSYRVGLCRKSSEEERKQRQQEREKEQSADRELSRKRQIVQVVFDLQNAGNNRISKRMIKESGATGDRGVVYGEIDQLVDGGELIVEKGGFYVLGAGELVDLVKSFEVV